MKIGPGPSSSGPSSSGNQYARVQVAALPFESSHGQHTRLDGAAGLGSGTTSKRLGCDERTIRRWLSDVPGFAAYVEECRESLTEEEPLDVLRDLLTSTDERVRLSAAQTLVRLPTGDKPTDEDDDLITELA